MVSEMERNTNQSGRMTSDRVEALKAFVDRAGSMADKQIAGLKNALRKFAVDKEDAKRFGYAIINELGEKEPDLDKIKLLLESGADANTTLNGHTVLTRASRKGRDKVVEMLPALWRRSGCTRP